MLAPETIWRELYICIPKFNRSSDICAALEHKVLAMIELPDCIASRRLARPTFWYAAENRIIESHVAEDNRNYIWMVDTHKHSKLLRHQDLGLAPYRQYLEENLAAALRSKAYK